MRAILQNKIIVVRGLYCFQQLYHVLVFQIPVDGYLVLEHIHTVPSELSQVDYLDSHSDMRPKDFHSFEDAATEALAQLIAAIVLVFANSNF